MEIYLDNSATTKIRKEVLERIIDVNKNCYGNPSSLHRMGLQAEKIMDEARKSVARVINANAGEIYFTGGGTESNNIAIMGLIGERVEKCNIVTTKIEHPSVYNVYEHLKSSVEVRYIESDEMGRVNIENLKASIDENTSLVSVMHVNNEVGIIQDLDKIIKIVKEKNKGTKIHVDAVQSYGKVKIDVKKLAVDTVAFSSHKIHGPKGVGGLFMRSGTKMNFITFGGGQEKSIRPGTENTPGIAGFGTACDLVLRGFREENNKLTELKKLYAKRLTEEIKDVRINSSLEEDGAPHILNVSFKNVKGEVLLHYLEQEEIYVSTGSACSSRVSGNRILEAVKLDREYIDGTIRISLGFFNNYEEVEHVVEKIGKSVEDIRKIMK